MNANNISCQLGLNDYSGKSTNTHVLSHRSSKVDLFANTKESTSTSSNEPATVIDIDQPSQSYHLTDVDNFDHILKVTTHQEAVYAYYYMDENNKVR